MQILILKGGMVLDGAGAPPVRADVLIRDGRIAEVGRPQAGEARVLDCTGLMVAPGFIDGHSHSDLQVLENRTEKALQGVTREVVGNCGFSPYPAPENRAPLHEFANGILHGGDDWGWRSAREYLDEVARRATLVGVESLVGHGTLRIACKTLEEMEAALDEALAEGACGFSTGLMYAPGSAAPPEELERLCRVVARRNKIYCTHMRDYGFKLVEAIDEQLDLARRTGCRLQISHLQAVGPANWHRQQQALERIEQAQDVDVAFDCYPYLCGSTVLTQLLPQTALEGGMGALMARLSDPPERSRIAKETIAGMAHRWTDLVISAAQRNHAVVGMTIQAIAEARGTDPIETVFDLLTEDRGAVNMLEYNQSEENLRQALTHPLANVISDGFYVTGRPHPRLHGTFPQLLGHICREKQWMTLPEAVHKITDKPAQRFRIQDRGRIQPNYHADLVVFDESKIGSPATYETPDQPPQGIHHILKKGTDALFL